VGVTAGAVRAYRNFELLEDVHIRIRDTATGRAETLAVAPVVARRGGSCKVFLYGD
jgi:hypothetical protein